MAKPPAFQLYVKDFLEGTAEMSNAEAGAYIKLLCHQWLKEGLKNDDKILIRFCNGDGEGLDIAKTKFEISEDGLLRNARLEITRQEQDEYRKKQSDKGKASAAKRAENFNRGSISVDHPVDTVVEVRLQPEVNPSPSSSSSPSSDVYNYNQISEEKFFEVLRQKAPITFSDNLLRAKAKQLFNEYRSQKIERLGALINTVIGKMKPDMKVKFYNPGAASYGYKTIDEWNRIKDNTALQFECYESV